MSGVWPGSLATVAFAAGVVGLGLTLCLLRRRSAAGALAVAAFAALAAASAGTALEAPWADGTLALSVAAMAAAVLAGLVRVRRDETAAARARADVEVLRADIARLGEARTEAERQARSRRDPADGESAACVGDDVVASLRDQAVRLDEARRFQETKALRLEDANRRLAETAARSERYLSAVSHELRTPLTSIRSFVEILLEHPDTDTVERREFLEIVLKESVRLTRLVNNVLDLARIEAGAMKLSPSEFDPRSVVDDVAASLRGAAADAGVVIAEECRRAPALLRADRDHVQQLLTNLVANALKFSPPGGCVVVRLTCGEDPERVRFEVCDQGPGIPEADVERVFDRFQRVEDGRSQAGTGLGLSICREIALLHGARIWVEREPGGGSRFVTEFPGVAEARSRASKPSLASA